MVYKLRIFYFFIFFIKVKSDINSYEEDDFDVEADSNLKYPSDNYYTEDNVSKTNLPNNNTISNKDLDYVNENDFYVNYLIDYMAKNPQEINNLIKLINKMKNISSIFLMVNDLMENEFVINRIDNSILLKNKNIIIFNKKDITYTHSDKKFIFLISNTEYNFIVKLFNTLYKNTLNIKHEELLKFFAFIDLKKYITTINVKNKINNNKNLQAPIIVNKTTPTINTNVITKKKSSSKNNKSSKNSYSSKKILQINRGIPKKILKVKSKKKKLKIKKK
jgi:hypothetical protein